MDLPVFMQLLQKIKGCTFASLDAVTAPKPGIRLIVKNERVILFTNKQTSGYGAMVKRRLLAAGKDPDTFLIGPLPWGERVDGTPLVYHAGKNEYYLQCVVLAQGECTYEMLGTGAKVNPLDFGIKPRFPVGQGLTESDAVYVHTYKLSSITELRILGETIEGFEVGTKSNTLKLNI